MEQDILHQFSPKALLMGGGILLMIIIMAVMFLWQHFFAPSTVYADLYSYYGLDQAGDVTAPQSEESLSAGAVIYGTEPQSGICMLGDGENAYLPLSFVQEKLNSRFYLDEANKTLYYALPTEMFAVVCGEKQYMAGGAVTQTAASYLIYNEATEAYYVHIELVAQYTDIVYGTFTEPMRLWLFGGTDASGVNCWDNLSLVSSTITGTQQKIPVRVSSSVKSDILTELASGDTCLVLGQSGPFMKIQTATGLIGYVKAKFLTDASPVSITHTYEEPVYESISMSDEVRLLWHQTLGGDTGVSSLPDIIVRTGGNVNVIAPSFFTLSDDSGNITSCATQEYVTIAHEAGLQVWAMVDNLNLPVDTYAILSDTSTRQVLIQNLMSEINRCGIDGINVDFESLSYETGVHYVQFIRELSIACRKEGIVLSVDNYVPSDYTAFYNRREQAVFADYIIMMGYDEHWAGSEPGSTSSLPFVKSGIEATLTEVPAEKFIVGVPFFTRIWNTTDQTSTACGMSTCIELATSYSESRVWMENLGQYYIAYEKDGISYEVWLEDLQSFKLRLDLINEYATAGIACWKAGLDTEEVWELME